MSCWRVLELTDQTSDGQVPPLLVKPQFDSDAYTVYITDLTNIWSEDLDLVGIVSRSFEEESPIEVSRGDTAQLGILLENVRRSLVTSDSSSSRITQASNDGIILRTTIALPEPLDSLTWRFSLRKRMPVILRNELIVPLLVSSHIQHERINNLVSTIDEKDRAITRLVDQYEASNLDLAAAFPSIGGTKPGRRTVKREQAARHVPGLQTFDEISWKAKTANLQDPNVSTLGLFQEALAECTPEVPPRLKSKDVDKTWWNAIDSTLKPATKIKAKAVEKKARPPPKPATDSETDEDETEDEFETHENFHLRAPPKPPAPCPLPNRALAQVRQMVEDDLNDGDDDYDNDDDDLDTPPKSQSQGRSGTQHEAPTGGVPNLNQASGSAPVVSPPPKENTPPAQKSKGKGFRIGGKTRNSESPPLSSTTAQDADQREEMPTRPKPEADAFTVRAEADTKPARKGFKIGGKPKAGTEKDIAGPVVASLKKSGEVEALVDRHFRPRSANPPSENTPVEGEREETTEEKADRKRRELKRKNEETAKKLTQSKKKKRF